MPTMRDGTLVMLLDGTKAELKQVQVNSWQTVLVAIELPPSGSSEPASQRHVVSVVQPRL